MEDRGLISRRTDPADKRRALVSITADDSTLLDQVTAEVEPDFLAHLVSNI